MSYFKKDVNILLSNISIIRHHIFRIRRPRQMFPLFPWGTSIKCLPGGILCTPGKANSLMVHATGFFTWLSPWKTENRNFHWPALYRVQNNFSFTGMAACGKGFAGGFYPSLGLIHPRNVKRGKYADRRHGGNTDPAVISTGINHPTNRIKIDMLLPIISQRSPGEFQCVISVSLRLFSSVKDILGLKSLTDDLHRYRLETLS